MDKFVIRGGRPLTGSIPTSGSKNSALPALAAALLTDEPVILRRIPKVRDIRTSQGLRGATIHFDRITVTGAEDLMMAATLADGVTILENAAQEPEVKDLADLLIKMGARIEGAGTSTIRIEGVKRLRGADHTIIG